MRVQNFHLIEAEAVQAVELASQDLMFAPRPRATQ
jgi:hypothetical protein